MKTFSFELTFKAYIYGVVPPSFVKNKHLVVCFKDRLVFVDRERPMLDFISARKALVLKALIDLLGGKIGRLDEVTLISTINGMQLKSELLVELSVRYFELRRFGRPKNSSPPLTRLLRSCKDRADYFRELALWVESFGDLWMANLLMEKARFYRPSGPFINRKLEEYSRKLRGGYGAAR